MNIKQEWIDFSMDAYHAEMERREMAGEAERSFRRKCRYRLKGAKWQDAQVITNDRDTAGHHAKRIN